jgi:hypothetical protein
MLTEIAVALSLAPEDRFYGPKAVEQYRRLLDGSNNHHRLQSLNELVERRKDGRRAIRRRLQKDQLAIIEREQKANLRVSQQRANTTYGRGNVPKDLRDKRITPGRAEDITEVAIEVARKISMAVAGEDVDNDMSEDIADEGSRLEPEEWEKLPEKITMQVDHDGVNLLDESEATRIAKERKAEIKAWIAKVSPWVESLNRFVPLLIVLPDRHDHESYSC